MRLTDFKVLTFDCYGTLIDWESGMIEALTEPDVRLVVRRALLCGRPIRVEVH